MFPVQETRVLAEAGAGQGKRASAYKALVNGDTGEVVSIVGRRYQVLHNSDALELALKGCTTVFPNTARRSWEVIGVHAPRSGGHCAIDLSHRRPGELGDFDWEIGPFTESFQPFLRVRNGYNGRTPFSLHFGFIRLACMNGWLGGRSMKIAKVSHDTKDIEEAVEGAIEKADFANVVETLRSALSRLHTEWFPRECFPPVIRAVLRVRRPKKLSDGRRADWVTFERRIEEKSISYAVELGDTGYALWNTVSDLSTFPPTGYPFISRSSHSLQLLARQWFSDFSLRIQDPEFEVDAYIRDLCAATGSQRSARRRHGQS